MNQPPSRDARFQQLFTSHRDAVWSDCYRRLPHDDVPDAVADVFLVAWRRIDRVPADGEALRWLYGVARNVVRNTHRGTARRRRLHERIAAMGPEQQPALELQVVQRTEDAELLEAVSRLGSLDQEMLRLRTWEELPLADIGAIVGRSPRSVESRLARVRKRLRRVLAVSTSTTPVGSPRPVEDGGER